MSALTFSRSPWTDGHLGELQVLAFPGRRKEAAKSCRSSGLRPGAPATRQLSRISPNQDAHPRDPHDQDMFQFAQLQDARGFKPKTQDGCFQFRSSVPSFNNDDDISCGVLF